jgi:hypothetical protein
MNLFHCSEHSSDSSNKNTSDHLHPLVGTKDSCAQTTACHGRDCLPVWGGGPQLDNGGVGLVEGQLCVPVEKRDDNRRGPPQASRAGNIHTVAPSEQPVESPDCNCRERKRGSGGIGIDKHKRAFTWSILLPRTFERGLDFKNFLRLHSLALFEDEYAGFEQSVAPSQATGEEPQLFRTAFPSWKR